MRRMEKRGGEWMKWVPDNETQEPATMLVYVCMRCIKRHCSLLLKTLVVTMKQCMQSYRAKPWQEGPSPKED